MSSYQLVGLALPVLQILNNYVQFEVSHGPSDVASMRLSRSRVTDGEWHHLLIELKSAKEGKDIKYLAVMTLDYGLDQVSWHLYPFWNRDLHVRDQSDPAMRQDLPEPWRIWGHTFWAPPEFGSCVLPYAGVTSIYLSRWSAPGLRNWTLSICVSHQGVISAFHSGFF